MCIIIDACCFSKVFDANNKMHGDFIPVLKWITVGGGSVVYGGRKYKKELSAAPSVLGIFQELDKMGKLRKLDDKNIDGLAGDMKKIEPGKNFNDEHLVAIVISSRCAVVCTDDKIAMSYLKKRKFYPKKIRTPKIYSNKKHQNLCKKDNIVGVCAG